MKHLAHGMLAFCNFCSSHACLLFVPFVRRLWDTLPSVALSRAVVGDLHQFCRGPLCLFRRRHAVHELVLGAERGANTALAMLTGREGRSPMISSRLRSIDASEDETDVAVQVVSMTQFCFEGKKREVYSGLLQLTTQLLDMHEHGIGIRIPIKGNDHLLASALHLLDFACSPTT